MLDERRAQVLRALVEEYISTGEPVSSRAVLECSRLDCSSATIRNDLSALEREGLAIQPHTSAGRVPTARAYRYYVDHLTPRQLRGDTRERIRKFFSSVHEELGRLLKSTSELVAELSKYPAVVTAPSMSTERIHAIHMMPLGGHVVLLVVITEAGRVSKEVLKLQLQPELHEVEEAERILEGLLRDRLLSDADGARDDIPANVAAGVRALVSAAVDAIADAELITQNVYLGGTSQMASAWEDLTTVHRVLEMLERETLLMGLMASSPLGTAIQIGSELGIADEVDLAMISTPYELGGSAGRIGVLGPMRMDYRRTISIVEEVSESLGERRET